MRLLRRFAPRNDKGGGTRNDKRGETCNDRMVYRITYNVYRIMNFMLYL